MPVRGTIHSYHIPSQAWSQNSRHGGYSQEYVEQAIERAVQNERAEREAVQAASDADWEAHFKALESLINARIPVPAVTQQTAAHELGLFSSTCCPMLRTLYDSFILCVDCVYFTISK
jgi:hypothetical protein